MIVWNFVSGKLLSKPSWLSNITKILVAFKLKLLTQFSTYVVFTFNPYAFFWTLVSFVCSSLTVNPQKANACSPWAPFLNVLKFEFQHAWTPPQIFFCGYRVLQLFCRNVQKAHDINCSQKSWNWNFANFKDLALILPQASTGCVQQKKVFYKNFTIFTRKHLCQSLFLSCKFIIKNFCFTTVAGFILCNYIYQADFK